MHMIKTQIILSCIYCLHNEYRIELEWNSFSVWQCVWCGGQRLNNYLLCIIFTQSHRFISPFYFQKVCRSRRDTNPKAWYSDVSILFKDFRNIYSPRRLIHKCTRTPSFYIEKKCKNIILERLLMKPLTNIHWLWEFQHIMIMVTR